MDSIINKLTEIESTASAIVQHAEAEKSALDEKFDKKRMDFDKELEADTQRQIQGIRDKLESETSRILSGQSQESQDELDALQKEYDEKHSDYAHEILRRITEVLLPSETESKDCLHLQILRGGISNFKYGILPQRQGKE